MVAVSIAAAIGRLRPVEVDTPLKMASSFALDALGRVYFCIVASLGILATLSPNTGPFQTTTQGGTTPSLYLLGLGKSSEPATHPGSLACSHFRYRRRNRSHRRNEHDGSHVILPVSVRWLIKFTHHS